MLPLGSPRVDSRHAEQLCLAGWFAGIELTAKVMSECGLAAILTGC